MAEFFLKLAFIVGGALLMLGLLIAGLVFIAYLHNRYEWEYEFKNWDRGKKLTYFSSLSIAELEQEIKSKFVPSLWNGIRFLKIADNRFVIYGVYLKAAIQVRSSNSYSTVELKIGQHWRTKTGATIFLLSWTGLFIFMFASDNVKTDGEPATLLDKIGMLAFVIFAFGIAAFLLNIGRDDFQKEIVRKLKLSRTNAQL